MLCCWFVVGLIKEELVEEELVEEDSEEKAEHRERERQCIGFGFYKSFITFFFFFNIMLMWKIVGDSEASVLYIVFL